jgi:hypothetical protein
VTAPESKAMIQFIVLMTIMAIWALTSLLSREAQPLPPRPTRGLNPDGSRPGQPLARREMSGPARYLSTSQGLSSPAPERRAPGLRGTEGQGLASTRMTSARPLSTEEGIVILDADARGTRAQPVLAPLPGSTAARAARGTPGRRGGKGRAGATSSSARSVEPRKTRALTSLVTQSMNDTKARPLEITPLSSPLAPLSAPLTQQTAAATVLPPGTSNAPPAFDSSQVRSMFGKPQRLREMAVLMEVLGPPVALRSSGRRR